MNRNLKTKLLAFVAITLGNAVCHCYAMQAEPGGAFGAIRTATPIRPQRANELPPIVSADDISSWQSGATTPNLPPIVTPNKFGPMASPIQSARPAPPIVSGEEIRKQAATAKPKKMGMLAPIVLDEPVSTPLGRPIAAPAPAIMMSDGMQSPAPTVMQATAAPTNPAMDNNVQQAAQWGPRGIPAGYSSGGVKIYRQDMPSVVGEIPMNSIMPAPQGLPPIISSDSQLVSPVDSMIGPSAIPISPVPMMSSPGMQPPMMASPAMPAPMMPQPSYMTGQSYINPPMMDAPVVSGGCGSCSGGGCSSCSSGVSSCSSCGTGGCFSESAVSNQFGCSGSVYSARRYLVVDAMYWDRDDGTIANSNFGALNNFDWDWGGRVTLGNRADATSGREITYMGTLPLTENRTRTDALARLSAGFATAGGFTGIESTAFRNSVFQDETKETSFHSIEFNRVKWGWDVVKTFVGLRYMYVDDDYSMLSTNNIGETGSFSMNALNNMIGPHIGGELFYDVGYRLSYSLLGKAGGYVNFNRLDTNLVNAGANFLDVRDSNVTLAGSLELGLTGHYQLSREARLRVGYNVLWLGEVASVSDNFSPFLSPLTGADAGDSDDMFFHGVSFGLEIYR